MKYIDEFRNSEIVRRLADEIRRSVTRQVSFMEVCGGHTHAIRRFGINSLLPPGVKLLSGPGCPVCVTGREYIDKSVELAARKDVIIATFGDLMRVPGSRSTLLAEKTGGADIRIVLSALEALKLASQNKGIRVVFLAIGFETTAPGTAAAIKKAMNEQIDNFLVLSAHKLMPPAMEVLLKDGTDIDGFICPGHVAAVTGSDIFSFIPAKYRKACVVTGFEPADILQAVLMLVIQVMNNNPSVETGYRRAVTREGNTKAADIMNEVFEPVDAEWRGLGWIGDSGLRCRENYRMFDAEQVFNLDVGKTEDDPVCICGEILRGRAVPADCHAFATVCTPDNPAGACMVSAEGACNAWYKYGEDYR